ncbi:gamma-glutamyl kinase [Rhodosalinus sp.]|uniref:gamma-glutamyl kinase n=1 Tax=Rhodosalinus sp. TaxID=2047741 RepID=UPI00397833EE
MLFFARERLVLLSVPKTGTTAWQSALGPHASMVVRDPPELKHAPVYRYNRFFRPMFEKFCDGPVEVVAVVREPVSWLGSWYRFRSRPFLQGRPTSTEGIDFDAFVRGYLAQPQPAFADVGSQAAFLAPRPNGARVHRVFRYESPTALADFLEARLGRRVTPAQENVSPAAPLDLSPETERALRTAHAADFTLWEAAEG